MKNIFKKLISSEKAINKSSKEKNNENYFQLATSWADDYYARMATSRYRYQMAFLAAMGLCGLLTISVMMLSNTHEYIPLLVHHYDSGAVSVSPVAQKGAPENQAEVESDLVRYVVSRESYDPAAFSEQYQLVSLLSDASVAHAYQAQQNGEDDQSYIHRFGNKMVRSVKVEEVSFLDTEEQNSKEKNQINHRNLAEIHFTVTDRNMSSGQEKRTPFVSIVSWNYGGIPNDPEVRWMNWNGFTVISYQRNQRTV